MGAGVAAERTLDGAVCFWSPQGPVCVERPTGAGGEGDAEPLLAALLAGPTAGEQAQPIWSAIPEGTSLERVELRPDRTLLVYLNVPPEPLLALNHATFEIIVNQIGWTLEPLGWRDLRIQTWDPGTQAFVSLADFLPDIPAPRKETVRQGEEAPWRAPDHVGQPSAPGQRQPQGALTGKTVYVSAGHGWQWNGLAWRTQRIPYPLPPYDGPIIEDHNNAEAVDQYLLHYLWNAGAQVIPVRERDMNAVAVVVDNDDPGPGAGYLETGAWATATITGTGYADTDYRWVETVTGTPTAAAVWTATLPSDGEYAVYVWYRPGSNRAPDARYTVHHAGGETSVIVDQQHHGITWHYVGTYGFRGGKEARITLSNQSAVTGSLVVADAVRFGGGTFDDLSGIATSAPSPPDKPWWEVAAFYYVQRMGMDQPPGDVTARPIYARWEHAGTGDDAVYVSWHTNGVSGHQTSARGTISIIHNGEGLSITLGSEQLRDAIHAELVHDLQAGWDPTWPGHKRSMNLGELRQLWDSDPAVRMPGALIEVAYHDHPTDTDALKEPYFNMLAARAMYQGIVSYFEGRDGVDLPLLPEPPTHLAVQNVGDGQVQVSWRPSPTDDLGLAGDPAAGYRVYTSTDGLGWSNGVSLTATAVYTLDGFSPGQLLFLRVAATNDGGESFPTESLAARVGDDVEVLLVSGFDRLNRTMLVSETDSVEGRNMRMFLDRMNRYDYVIQHGEVISHPFDGASNEAVRDGVVCLTDYVLVDWILGEESAPDETLDATERALLAGFLGGQGALFLSGSEVGYHLDDQGGDPDFYNAYLRASYAGDDAETYVVASVPGAIFEGLGPFRFDAPGMYDADYPDQLMPIGGSMAALAYSGGLTGTAALQYADGCQRLVYFGFPFETIWPAQRPAVMDRVLGYLGACMSSPVDTTILTPTHGSAHRVVPSFAGTAEVGGQAVLDRVMVQIERGIDGHYWTGTGWTVEPAWAVAAGTVTWSYALPALGQSDYHLRAQAWTADGQADGSPAEVVFTYDTLSPTSTVLVTPTGGVHIPAPVSVTLVWQPVGPDGGSPLAYLVALDEGQFYTTTQAAYTVTQLAGGLHTWGVQVLDAAGNRSGWVTDTFWYPSLETRISTPVHGSAHKVVPPFGGTVDLLREGVVIDRVEVQIRRDSDASYWTGSEWVSGPALVTGTLWMPTTVWLTGTEPLSPGNEAAVSWAYALPPLSDSSYYLSARAWATDGEEDESPAGAAFIYDTLPPTATVLITPTGGVHIGAPVSVTLAWQPVAPDGGSSLAYLVGLDGRRFYTASQSVYTLTHITGGWHTWGVQVLDAAGNRSAWVTDTFALDRHTLWLPVLMRSFELRGGGCVDVLVNGGFESDEGWVLNALATYATDQFHTGARSARLGIPPEEPGEYIYSSVAQALTLAEGVTATLRLWVYPIGEGDDPHDRHYVGLSDGVGDYHSLDVWRSDAQAWEERVYELDDYQGQMVTLYIGTMNDGDDDTAALYVDDVTLEVCP